MARENIDDTNVKVVPGGGYNLTDSADFKTLTLGVDNGVEFTYANTDLVMLKAPGGGAADFTIVTRQKDPHNARNVVVPDVTVTVDAGDVWVFSMSDGLNKDASTNLCAIDCDVAGEVLVIRRNPN